MAKSPIRKKQGGKGESKPLTSNNTTTEIQDADVKEPTTNVNVVGPETEINDNAHTVVLDNATTESPHAEAVALVHAAATETNNPNVLGATTKSPKEDSINNSQQVVLDKVTSTTDKVEIDADSVTSEIYDDPIDMAKMATNLAMDIQPVSTSLIDPKDAIAVAAVVHAASLSKKETASSNSKNTNVISKSNVVQGKAREGDIPEALSDVDSDRQVDKEHIASEKSRLGRDEYSNANASASATSTTTTRTRQRDGNSNTLSIARHPDDRMPMGECPDNTMKMPKMITNAKLRHTFNLKVVDEVSAAIGRALDKIKNIGELKLRSLLNLFENTLVQINKRLDEAKHKELELSNAKISGGGGAEKGIKSEKSKSFIRDIMSHDFGGQAVKMAMDLYKSNNKFMRRIHKKLAYIRKFEQLMRDSKEQYELWAKKQDAGSQLVWAYNDYEDYLAKIKKEVDPKIGEAKSMINIAFKTFRDNYLDYQKRLENTFNLEIEADDKQFVIENANKTRDKIEKIWYKLIYMYNNERSLMDIILDSHFISLYVLKVIHFAIINMSLFLTEKIFSEMYMKAVYAENGDPPSLNIMLAIFLAIDFGLILFLLTVMFLLMYIFQRPSKDFIINPDLIKSFIFDYLVFIVFLFIILVVIAKYMEIKKYFRYNTEGLRGIRALKDITIGVSAIILLIPFFTLF